MNRLIPILVLFLAVFSGCGSSDGRKKDGRDAGGSVIGTGGLTYDASVPVNDGKKVTIAFWTQADQDNIYRRLIDDYVKLHPNVQIELTSADFKDHFNKLQISLQSELGPDIFHMHNSFGDTLLPYMRPYPEEVFPREALLKDFRQVESHIIDGKIYFIDTGLMTSSIYYNLDMWKEAGLTDRDVPRTWDELRRIAKLLTRYDPDGGILRSGFNPNGQGFSLFTAMNLQQGESLFTGPDSSIPVLATEASRRSLDFLRNLYRADKIADMRQPECHESFGMASTAMIYGWGWTNGWLKKHFPELEYGIFHIPSWTMETPRYFDRNNGESSMGVNRRSPETRQAAAFDLIKFFLVKDEYLIELCGQFGVAPGKRSLESYPAFRNDRLLSTFFSMLDKTIWFNSLPSFYETTLTSMLIDPVIIDDAGIDGSLESAEKRLKELFAQRYSTELTRNTKK